MYTKVEYNKAYISELSELFELLEKTLKKKTYTIANSDDVSLYTENIVHFLTLLNSGSQIKSIVRDILIETCKKTRTAGGDDKIVIEFMINYIHEQLKSLRLNHKQNQKMLQIEKIKSIINNNKTYPQFNELKKHIYKQFDKNISDIVFESYRLAGLTGKIFIDKKNIPEPQVELIDGNVFNLNVDNQFLNNKSWDNQNVKCLIVEGIIEDVHEIHLILEEISETKEPLIIFATGFGNNVLSTLYANKIRGTLDVIPIQIMQSIENINTLKDLSIVAGSEMISSLKGQTLVGIKAIDLNTVNRVICTNNTVIIQNNNSSAVQKHLNDLLIRKKESTVDDVKDLYDKRIKSLASNYVQISVPDDVKHKEDAIFEKLSNCIYTVKTLISRGLINIGDVFNDDTQGYYSSCIYKSLLKLESHNMTTNTLLAILNYGITNSNLLLSTENAVLADA